MNLKDKVVAVFAANGAISSEVALEMARQGAVCYLSGRNLDEIQKLSDTIAKEGGTAYAHQVDALNESEIEQFYKEIIGKQGRLEVVFNGIGLRAKDAGYGLPSTVIPFDQFMKPIQAHLGSQFLTARIGAKYMQQANSKGAIIMLTASLSRIKAPFMTGVSAACSGIEGLTRSLAAEYGMSGIKVTCLNPTVMPETRTIIETNRENAKAAGIPEEVMAESMKDGGLLKRTLTTKDTAKVAAFLATDAGAVFNSHVVDVDFGTANVI